jgi:hypothetical protein
VYSIPVLAAQARNGCTDVHTGQYSLLQVAKGLVQLYTQCLEGDFSTIKRLSGITSGAQKSAGFAVCCLMQAMPLERTISEFLVIDAEVEVKHFHDFVLGFHDSTAPLVFYAFPM